MSPGDYTYMTSEEFENLLRQTGHFYTGDPLRAEDKTEPPSRHLVKADTTELALLCVEQDRMPAGNERVLMANEFHHDLSCPICRKLAGLADIRSVTKRSVMLNAVNVLVDIEQMFLEAIYWKEFRKDEKPINPDPDGTMARYWLEHADQLIKMIERCRPLMKSHEGRYRWPDQLGGQE